MTTITRSLMEASKLNKIFFEKLTLEERLIFSMVFEKALNESNVSKSDLKRINLEEFVSQATKHRLLQLISHKDIKNYGLDFASFADIETDAQLYCQNAHATQIEDLKLVSKLYGVENIPFILTKGLDVAFKLYNAPYRRPSTDLDILVSADNLIEAYEILHKNGFSLSKIKKQKFSKLKILRIIKNCGTFCEPISMKKETSEVDIHPIKSGHFKNLMALSISRSIKENDYNSLSDIDNLEFLLRHIKKHNFQRGLWLNDLQLFLKTLSDSELNSYYHECKKRGIAKTYLLALVFSYAICGLTLKPNTKQKLISITQGKKLLCLVSKQLHCSNKSWKKTLFNLKTQIYCNENLVDNLRTIVRKCFCPTLADFSFLVLPSRFSNLYYILRPVRFFFRLTLDLIKKK